MPNFHFKGGAGRAYQGILLDKPYSYMPQTNGAHRSSVVLDGANSTFHSNDSLIGIADEWTIGLWVRPDWNSKADRTPLIIKPSGSDNNRIDIMAQYVTGGLGIFGGGQVRLHDSAGVLKKDWNWWFTGVASWHYMAITWDGTTALAHYNGIPNVPGLAKPTDDPLTMTDEPRQIQIGSNSGANAGYLGWISELQIWDEVLDPDEIIQLVNHGFPGRLDLTKDVPGYASSANLQHWYRFGYDVAKIGRDFTLVRDRLDIDHVDNNVDEDEIRSAGPRGYSVDMGAQSNFVSSAVDLGFADTWTTSTWYKTDIDMTAYKTLYQIKQQSGNANQTIARFEPDSRFKVYTYASDGVTLHTDQFLDSTPDNFPIGGWVNLVVVHTPGIMEYYFNGVQRVPGIRAGVIGPHTNTTRRFAVGSSITSTVDIQGGQFAEFAIWNSALTQAEIASIYNNGVYDRDLSENFEDYVSKSSLTQWWWIGDSPKSDEVGGDVAVRKAGNTTIVGSAVNLVSVVGKDPAAGSGTAPTLDSAFKQGYSLAEDTSKLIGISDIWSISGWFRQTEAGGVVSEDSCLFDTVREADSTDDNSRILIRGMGELANDPFRVTTRDSNGELLITRDVVGAVDGVGFTFDEWRHYVVTWNGYTRTVAIYLDGTLAVLDDTAGYNDLGSGNQVNADRMVSLGTCLDPDFDLWLNGQLCDTIIWNKELRAEEARQVYSLGHTFNPAININAYRSAANVMHWWPLHDISDTDTSIGQDKINYKGGVYHLIPRAEGASPPDVSDPGMFFGKGPYDNTLA